MVVTVYSDRSFTFITKTPPASILLKRAAGIAKGSGAPDKDKVGKVTAKQVEDIARQKMPDLNAASVESAMKSVRGTARSMGIEVVGLRNGKGTDFSRAAKPQILFRGLAPSRKYYGPSEQRRAVGDRKNR